VDNYLPLYQSIEHIRTQTLLPIRFLGNDTSVDDTNKLLRDYLHIKKLSFYPETNSDPIPIQCAELGIKQLTNDDNFFLMYYNYIVDFSETQKKKLQEEEEEKRRREQEYHNYNQSPRDVNQRSLMKTDSSPSPPPSYSTITTRTNENRKPVSNERRPSYGEAVTNGISYGTSNDTNRQYPELQNNIQIMHRTPYISDNYQNTNKQSQPPGSNWEPVTDELASNGKIINYNNTNSRGSDSKLKQGKSLSIFRKERKYFVVDMCACAEKQKSSNYIYSLNFFCYFQTFASNLTGKHFCLLVALACLRPRGVND
jgi:hypothetical protein